MHVHVRKYQSTRAEGVSRESMRGMHCTGGYVWKVERVHVRVRWSAAIGPILKQEGSAWSEP